MEVFSSSLENILREAKVLCKGEINDTMYIFIILAWLGLAQLTLIERVISCI
jgi:hypothetical protein